MATLLYRLGRSAARRARLVVAVWLVVLGVVGLGYWFGAGTLSSAVTIPGTPTAEVTDRLAAELPGAGGGTGNVVLSSADGGPFSTEQQRAISERVAEVAVVEGVSGAVDPFVTEAERAARTEELSAGAAQIERARQELEAGQAQIDAAREQAAAAGMIDQVGPELDAQEAQLDAGAAELDAQERQLAVATRMLEMAAEIRLVSADGSTAIVPVSFADPVFEVAEETREAVVDAFAADPVAGVRADFSSELVGGVPEVLGIGEAVGVVIAAVVLVVMLGTLVAAGLPIVTALLGVGVGALGALALSGVVEMVSVTPVLGVMLGLAVGIDYSLFIVNRHRRQLQEGYHVEESIGLANGTSGNAVVFAGTTVLIALLALNVTGIPFLGLMGTVAAACVAIAVLVAVTLTPALLGLLGARVLRRRDRGAAAGTAGSGRGGADGEAALPGGARRRARPSRPMSNLGAVARVALGIVALVVIAVPALDLRLGLPDGSSEPADSTAYRSYSTIADKFGPGQNGPLLVVADLPASSGEQELLAVQVRVAEQIFAHDDVVAVAPLAVSEDGTVATFQVVPVEGPTSVSTEELVHDLRAMSPLDGTSAGGEVEIGVAGLASGNIDISAKLADALPTYLAVVVGLSLIILMVVFRSIVVPVIATAGFVLSFFAALGGVVAIYQWGWLGSVFDVHEPGPILSFLPTLLVGILFGLAMDYMLFLGTGMREAYAHGAPARQAVAQGVHAGRAVVTAAAIIMGSVFGGFVFADSAMIRPIGFALAFGVLLDAFVVRMLVIPALMHLVGDAAWWLPRWLDRLLPDVDVEGSTLERRQPLSRVPAEVAG